MSDDPFVYVPATKIHKLLGEKAYKLEQGANGETFNTENSTSLNYTTRQVKRYTKSPYNSVLPVTYPIANNSVYVQFRLETGQYDRIILIIVEMTLANTGSSTSSVTVSPAHFIISQLNVGLNGSDAAFIYFQPRELYERLQYASDENLRLIFANNGINLSSTDYKTTQSITGGSSLFVSFPLVYPLLNKLNMDTLRAPVYLSFYLDGSPIVSNSSGTLVLQSFNLRFVVEENKRTHNEMLSMFKMYPTLLPFVYSQQFAFPSIQLNAGSMTDILLSSVIGCVAMITVGILQNNASNANNGYISYTSISGTDTTLTSGYVDILDVNKNTIFASTTGLTERYLRILNNLTYGGNSLSLVQPILFIPFCRWPRSDLITGNMTSYRYFNGENYVRICPGSTFTSGSYTVMINVYFYRAFRQKDGLIYSEY